MERSSSSGDSWQPVSRFLSPAAAEAADRSEAPACGLRAPLCRVRPQREVRRAIGREGPGASGPGAVGCWEKGKKAGPPGNVGSGKVTARGDLERGASQSTKPLTGRKPFLRPVVLLAGLRIKCHATGARRKSQLRARVSDILADGALRQATRSLRGRRSGVGSGGPGGRTRTGRRVRGEVWETPLRRSVPEVKGRPG